MRKNLVLFLSVLCLSCNEEEGPSGNDTPAKIDTPVKVLPPITHYTVPDNSPMDMVYFPGDYPLLKMAEKTSSPPLMRIIYSRPQKQNRKIFNGLIKYDVPWRLGANESTEIEFFSVATIQNKTIKPGRYILYCIPQETKWSLVFNSNLYSWGLQQNQQKDLLKFEVPVEKNSGVIEYFTIAIEKRSDKNAEIIFLWDDVKARLPVSF
ncbi:MAG TPA: DUF2911 domain-containing protein [Chitinophagaceae bacterium]|nr:DUF2911 domain-containing protein [Chitinophagaceae bacterium]